MKGTRNFTSVPVCCLSLLAASALAATNVLEVFDFDFGQAPSNHIDPTINVGDTILWTWNSNNTMPHTTTAAAGQLDSWDSGLHSQPFTFSHTFQNVGTFGYYCTLHGADLGGGQVVGMSGRIVVVGSTPSLAVTKSATPNPVSPGGNLTYTIAVANNTASNAASLVLSDTLPANVTFISATASQGTCVESAGLVTCDLGSLAASAVATVTVVVVASGQDSLCNTATVAAADLVNSTASACVSVAAAGTHDLAVVAIKAPRTIALTRTKLSQSRFVRAIIVNRSVQNETIADSDAFRNLVTLELESRGTNCVAPVAQFILGPPQRRLPVILRPKRKFPVVFMVTYDCANDPMKGAGHKDFSYKATVHHEAIDGQLDSNPANDTCPRDAVTGGVDKGCGSKKPDGTFGDPVATDVTATM